MNKISKFLMAGVMSLTVLAGCGSNTGGSVELQEGDTVKIGLNYELSGGTSTYGMAMDKGSRLAIKQYNEKEGHKYNIEYVSLDNKGDSSEAISIATRMMTEEQVAFVVGPATSTASIATYPVAGQNQVPVLSPAVTQNGGMMNGDTAYEYALACLLRGQRAGERDGDLFHIVTWASARRSSTRMSRMTMRPVWEKDFKKKFEELGGEVVSVESYQQGDTDFNAVITNIKSMDFDVLYIPGYYSESGLIIKQARDAGITQTIVGPDGMDSPKLMELAGAANLNDVYFTTAYTTVNASEELQNFIESYKAEYNEEPDMFSVLAFDATNLGLQALEEAGATGEALNNAIANMEFTGLTGSFGFDDAHTPTKKVLVVQLEDGVQVNPVEVDPNS